MSIESRQSWQAEVQRSFPKWGTREPVTWREISFNIFDSTGRPISEAFKPNPAGVVFKYKKLPFLDSRQGNSGNDSAYKALSHDAHRSLGILAYLRSELPTPKHESEFDTLFRVVNAGHVLPVWYVYKSDDPMRNGEVPPHIAGVTKIARGLQKPFAYTEYAVVQDRYQGVQSKPDVSFLKSTQAFYN
ncbi:hypothetical protein HY310_03615, partial [Candidatus Microgenomates bacterium]|nr:hypothetical protein [Candidatus Microgenomates bacterium]